MVPTKIKIKYMCYKGNSSNLISVHIGLHYDGDVEPDWRLRITSG